MKTSSSSSWTSDLFLWMTWPWTPWISPAKTKTWPCIASFLRQISWRWRKIAIISSGENVVVDLKSQDNMAVNPMNISGETVALDCKLSAGKYRENYVKWPSNSKCRNYVKSPSFPPAKTASWTCKKHGLEPRGYRRRKMPWIASFLPVNIVKITWNGHQSSWWGSGLFRTPYSVAKSEGKSGSSEKKTRKRK